MTTTTRRPWPQPAAGESDFVIRDEARVARLIRRAKDASSCTGSAAYVRLQHHWTAVDVNDALEDVLERYVSERGKA